VALQHTKQYITVCLWFSVQDSVALDVREFLKGLYDFTKCIETGLPSGDALPELIIQGFDEEQIWQELELQNVVRSKGLLSDVASLVAHKALLKFPVRSKNEETVTDDEELEKDYGIVSASDSETDVSAVTEPVIKKAKGQLVFVYFFLSRVMYFFVVRSACLFICGLCSDAHSAMYVM
jgi:U3 small nucleolar RNA-associated protein MPP10